MRLALLLLLLGSGCRTSGVIDLSPDDTNPDDTGVVDTDTDDPDTDGACGEVTVWDLTVKGSVEQPNGDPAVGAAVELQDRGWVPGTVLGSAMSDTQGQFTMDVSDLTSVDDCWGTILDYVLFAERGSREGELGINLHLHTAINDGSLLADLSRVPVELQ